VFIILRRWVGGDEGKSREGGGNVLALTQYGYLLESTLYGRIPVRRGGHFSRKERLEEKNCRLPSKKAGPGHSKRKNREKSEVGAKDESAGEG